jgi:excisionase family DNA binding protein
MRMAENVDIKSGYITLDELAAYAAVSKMTLRRWIARDMPFYKYGRVIRVKISEFDAWILQFRSSGKVAKEQVLSAWDEALRRAE